ncbi:MAG: flagellar biosynthetic protein FliO [Planctomycetaceae bacterium]|nr:flagellar biosynthetic protein FliO [Planctomycetaceae bacterium]
MHQKLATSRRIAGPTDGSRRGAISVALGVLLMTATVAAAREPGGASGPYTAADEGFGLSTPIAQPLREVDAAIESDESALRTADWLESTADQTEEAGAVSAVGVLPVAGETETTGPAAQLSPEESAEPQAGRGGLPAANDPLSRLKWSGASEQVDPAETLRDWAEGAGLLVAFVVVSLWIVRQYVAKRANPGGPTTHLRTIESLTLPQRCRVHLLDVGGRQVLVAADAAGVKCITVLPDRFHSLLDDAAHEEAAAPPTEPERDQIWEAIRETRLT